MKNYFFSILLVILANNTFSQDKSKIFSSDDMIWYGLDFTKAKFVGQFDQGAGIAPATGSDMKNKWIGQWNSLIVNEPTHYDLRKTFRKVNVYNDLGGMNVLNSKIDVDACMTYNPQKLEKAGIEEMIKKYSGDKKEGLGCSFVVENFDKGSQMASLYVVFFDIASHKILLCERMEGKCMGIGMRNYWAGAIKAILKQIDTAQYKIWKDN